MANVVELDNLLSVLLSSKGKEIISTYTNLNATTYAKFAEWFSFLSASGPAVGLSGLRLMFCEADGTVLYDSAQGVNNTLQMYRDKKINENHNSRLAIIKALLSASGRGYEVKRSTSTGVVETYLALRLGTSSETPAGSVRISYRP
jgi:hypothetical protein